ncbi:MAG: hypothetical protein QY326_09525 [Bdellovibrionota bacterium]|nr:MAG: hypothetical protein QY326_09525 [Bdellovibrionota bacterium]
MNGHRIFDAIANFLKILLLLIILRILLPAVGIPLRIPILDDVFIWLVRMIRSLVHWVTIFLANNGISI